MSITTKRRYGLNNITKQGMLWTSNSWLIQQWLLLRPLIENGHLGGCFDLSECNLTMQYNDTLLLFQAGILLYLGVLQ